MEIISIGKSKPLKYSGSHFHDDWEIILNIEGSGTMTVGDTELPFTEGDVICIPPGTAHTKKGDGYFCDMFIKLCGLRFPCTSHIKFADRDGSVQSLLCMMHSIYHKKEKNYKSITEQLASALEQLIIGRTESEVPDKRTELITSIIVEHFSEPDFSVYESLESLGYCTDHVRRIFSRDMSMSPLEYLTSVRIGHAKKLLRENYRLHYTIAEIAISSGYADISYFSRIFKKHTGLSPRAYLEQHCTESVESEPSSEPDYDDCCGVVY